MSESVATKADLAEIRHEMIRMEDRLVSQMALLRSELKIWMGSVAAGLFASLGVLMAVFKFLIH